MYDTKLLLTALDSIIESAHDRLTTEELQLLGNIRSGIANARNEELIEKHIIDLIKFILPIKEYIDKFL